MSLRHALLGLLAEHPASGWDLSRRFDNVLGSVWAAGHPQIYGELHKLKQDRLIEIDSEGPRRRKAYRITEEGLVEVRRWLAVGEVDHTLRLEPLLRAVFFWLMSPAELAEHLDRETSYFDQLAQRYRGLIEAEHPTEHGSTSRQIQSLRIAAEAGLRLSDALGEWATWAKAASSSHADNA